MDYVLLEKMKSREIKGLLENTWLKVTGKKRESVARVFAACENGV